MTTTVTYNLLDDDEIEINRQQLKRFKGVYFLFSGEEIVYIGQSGNILSRVVSHLGSQIYCDMRLTSFSFVELEKDLDLIEFLYISKFRPKFNVSGAK